MSFFVWLKRKGEYRMGTDRAPPWAQALDAKLNQVLWQTQRTLKVEGQIIELITELMGNPALDPARLEALRTKLKVSHDALQAVIEANQPKP